MTPTPRNKMLRRCKRCKTRAALPLDVYCQHCKPTPPGYAALHSGGCDRGEGTEAVSKTVDGRAYTIGRRSAGVDPESED